MTACVALGSNLGDRAAHIDFGFDQLDRLDGTSVVGRSSVLETDPVGPPDQGPYLNAACVLETTLDARALLGAMLEIEATAGRQRGKDQVKWGPRTLDLDLLLFGDSVIDEPGLCVPHPRLRERLFVLQPLAEVAPDARVPPDGKTVRELLEALR
ncbi:MAG: 2-amino-4-hydroxy-6-hydroxymethyldihydropteridine diphosphokinase [Planctomycetota bacterium]